MVSSLFAFLFTVFPPSGSFASLFNFWAFFRNSSHAPPPKHFPGLPRANALFQARVPTALRLQFSFGIYYYFSYYVGYFHLFHLLMNIKYRLSEV